MGDIDQARPRRRAMLVGIGLAGVFGLFAIASMKGQVARSHPSIAQGGIGATDRGGPPLAGGVQVTLAKAQSMTGLTALLPETSLASTSSISAVWARSSEPDMLVMYRSGVQAEVRPWTLTTQTPDEHWKAIMSDGLPGSIVTVSAQDMYVMPPGGQGGTGSVNFVTAGGTWVTVYGDGTFSASQLQDMATSASAQVTQVG